MIVYSLFSENGDDSFDDLTFKVKFGIRFCLKTYRFFIRPQIQTNRNEKAAPFYSFAFKELISFFTFSKSIN